MAQLDRTTARALVEAGYMPLSHYIEMFEPRTRLQEMASPSTAPDDDREKLERWLMSTTFNTK
ncbi:MAG TPA: hypothetical protein VFK79_09535 [Xanthobacteraceae bacterium]|nr:hypothetical protein [Xanthobacteraceae bacterium]